MNRGGESSPTVVGKPDSPLQLRGCGKVRQDRCFREGATPGSAWPRRLDDKRPGDEPPSPARADQPASTPQASASITRVSAARRLRIRSASAFGSPKTVPQPTSADMQLGAVTVRLWIDVTRGAAVMGSMMWW